MSRPTLPRLELLELVVARARSNGFELRRWYMSRLGLPWISADAAIRLLDQQRRYYALLFSHEFASNFWKTGTDITFEVPAATHERVMPDGSVRVIKRKPFTRRSARPDVWRYHLQQMALAEEPLRYLRRYLRIEEDLAPEPAPEPPRRGRPKREPNPALDTTAPALAKSAGRKRLIPRPHSAGKPDFLKRPYQSSRP